MAKKSKNMLGDDELTSIIDDRKGSALNYRNGELSDKRINLLQRYLGKPYGTERQGQSQVVTRQCLEAVEWTLPSLLRVFLSSPTIVEFEPEGADDEAAAKQETDALNHVFLKKNDGFMTLYTWIKDTLMNPVGYVKVYWCEEEQTKTEKYKGLTSPEVTLLLDDSDIEVVEQEEYMELVQTPMGPQPVSMFEIELKRTTRNGRPVVEPVPPEELTVDDKLDVVSLEKADFVCHTTQKTRSSLIQQGFDEETVYSLPSYTEQYDERRTRHDAAEERGTALDRNVVSDDSMELVEIDEAYLYVDYDGDGIAEFRRVTMGSGTSIILENEEADMLPFVAMTSIPLPHTHVGVSWMELVEDLQKINTTITRQLLNNMYRTNNPRTVVGRGVNLSDLINDLPNSPIRAQNIDQLRTEPVAPMIGQILPAFDLLDGMSERRTGVTKRSMGLDADTLSRVNESAFLGTEQNANQRIEALARVIAECGVKPLFLKLHQLMMTHQEDVFEAKINGQWAQINPAEWRERTNMTCMVGLGTGNKQGQMLSLNKIVEMQEKLLMAGKEDMVTDQHLYNSVQKMVEISGLEIADKYVANPATMPPKQPQPPPPDANMELVKVEAKKVELQNQQKMMEMQQKQAETQMKLMEKSEELRLKAKDLERKEYEVLLKSENDQAKIDQSNLQELNRLQNEAKAGMND